MPRLYISAGHSGQGESGTSSKKDGTNEKQVTTAILQECARLGMKTVPQVSLRERIAFVNRNLEEGDLLLEIHCDSQDTRPGTDCGVYYLDRNAYSEGMGRRIVEAWKKEMQHNEVWLLPDTKARQGRLGIIRDTTKPAWLLEMVDIDDVEKRDFAVAKGAAALLKIERLLFKGEADDTPPDWAAPSWKKATTGANPVFTTGRPNDAITDNEMQFVFVKLKGKEKVTAKPMTRAEFAKVLDTFNLI